MAHAARRSCAVRTDDAARRRFTLMKWPYLQRVVTDVIRTGDDVRRGAEAAVAKQVDRVASRVIPVVVDAVVSRIDLTDLVARHVDIDELVARHVRSEEHTSELQSRQYLVCRLL